MKQFIVTIAAIVVTVIIYTNFQPTETEEIDTAWIMEEIKGIGKLSFFVHSIIPVADLFPCFWFYSAALKAPEKFVAAYNLHHRDHPFCPVHKSFLRDFE